jgi:hypothetical protein
MVFRLLGHVAALDARLSRVRINFIPVSLGLLGLLVLGIVAGLLAIDQRPASALIGVAVTMACSLAVALLLVVHLKRHTIFRAHPATRTEPPSAVNASHEVIDVRVTAVMSLNEDTACRFLDVVAQGGMLGTGELVFLANVDASTSFMGVGTANRAGWWTLHMPAGSLGPVVRGELSLGGRVRAAAQFDITDRRRGSQQVTLSFGSAVQRERILRELERRCTTVHGSAAA